MSRSPSYGPHTVDLKVPSARPKSRPHPWYVPGQGWIYLSKTGYAEKLAENAARFTAAALAAQAARDATSRPTRWPAKHMPLLVHLRSMSTDGWRWNYNGSKKSTAGLDAGAVFLLSPDGEELEYVSLDDAAGDLVVGPTTAKRTGKAELVRFLHTVHEHLPAEHQVVARQLLDAA